MIQAHPTSTFNCRPTSALDSRMRWYLLKSQLSCHLNLNHRELSDGWNINTIAFQHLVSTMATAHTIGVAVDATGRSTFNAYMVINNSEKADHPVCAASLVPLVVMTWQDVFNTADAVAKHLAAGRGQLTVVNISLSLSNVLHCCAPAGPDLGHSPQALWKGIQKRHNVCWWGAVQLHGNWWGVQHSSTFIIG